MLKTLILMAIYGIGIGSGSLFAFEGNWYSPTGQSINFIQVNTNELVGMTNIYYVDNDGQRTGEKIEYHFQFTNADAKAKTISGKLRTFDSHYGCYFENGAAQAVKNEDGSLALSFPKIIFKVVAQYQVKSYWQPRYCSYYDNYNGYDYRYICGRRRVEIANDQPFKRECVVTNRITSAIRLTQ